MHRRHALLLVAAGCLASASLAEPLGRVVTVDQAAELLTSGQAVALHVASDQDRYELGHLPGARFLPWSAVATTRHGNENELPPVAEMVAAFSAVGTGDHRPLILYGETRGLRAARTALALEYLGHGHRAHYLDGGLEAWRASGRAVELGAPPVVTPDPLTPRLWPEILISRTEVADVSWLVSNGHRGLALVDARPHNQHTGEVAGEHITRPGHIPGAVSIFWEEHLAGEGTLLKPLDELRELYTSRGVRPGDTVVVYCRTGGQASHAWFVATLLGYHVQFYDGSYTEWQQDPALPVARGD